MAVCFAGGEFGASHAFAFAASTGFGFTNPDLARSAIIHHGALDDAVVIAATRVAQIRTTTRNASRECLGAIGVI